MKTRYALVLSTGLILGLAASAYFSYLSGYGAGVADAVALIQASCENENTVTKLNGKAYVCLNAVMWNKIVTIMHAIGVDGSNGGGDANEALPPLPHGPSAPGLRS